MVKQFSSKMTLGVRWMIRRDVPDCVRIDIQSSPHTKPWVEEDFLYYLRQKHAIGMVATVIQGDQETILGYMIYEIHRNRLHLVGLAIDPEYRRRGVGTLIINRLIDKLESHKRSRITLRVHERNLEAQLFFKSVDFRSAGVERRYYEDGDDAFRFVYAPPQEMAPMADVLDRVLGGEGG